MIEGKSDIAPGDIIAYQRRGSQHFEIGLVKRVVDDGAFVYCMQGETAAKTPFDCICKIQNQNMFESMVMRKIAYEKMGGEVR